MTNGRPKPEDASDRELLDGVKGRWGLNYQMGFEAEFLRRLAASQPGEPGKARCPKCGGVNLALYSCDDGFMVGYCNAPSCKYKGEFWGFVRPSAPQSQSPAPPSEANVPTEEK